MKQWHECPDWIVGLVFVLAVIFLVDIAIWVFK